MRIPALILAATALRIDQEVDIREEDGRIVIAPIAAMSFDLNALLDAMKPDTFPDEIADQVKSLDWRARKAIKKGEISRAALTEVQAKIGSLLQL